MKAQDYDNFEDLIDAAEDGASTDWEMEFIDGVKEKYEQYGGNMFVSDKQLEVLEKLAG